MCSLFFIQSTLSADDEIICFGGNATIPGERVVREGNSLTYHINLCNAPEGDTTVEVNLKIDERWNTELKVNYAPKPIVFDQANWNLPVAIEVEVSADTNEKEPSEQILTIEHIADSSDERFKHKDKGQELEITILDLYTINYLPVVHKNDPPTPIPTPTATPIATWQKFTQLSADIDTIVVNNQQLLLGSRDPDDSKKGIYQSTSCKLNSNFSLNLQGKRVQAIDFNGIFGIAAVNGDSIYYTTNSGATWLRTGSNTNPFMLAATFTQNGTAYAGADDGVYVSTNRGESWSKVNSSKNPKLINDFTYDNATDNLWIGALGSGAWKLKANTTNFEQRNAGLARSDTDGYVWDTEIQAANQIFIATTNGVYSSNGDAAWNQFGLQNKQVLSLAIAANTLYAGTLADGLWQKFLNGQSEWQKVQGNIGTNLTIRDLVYDQSTSTFCDDPISKRDALLAATNDGIWIYR